MQNVKKSQKICDFHGGHVGCQKIKFPSFGNKTIFLCKRFLLFLTTNLAAVKPSSIGKLKTPQRILISVVLN